MVSVPQEEAADKIKVLVCGAEVIKMLVSDFDVEKLCCGSEVETDLVPLTPGSDRQTGSPETEEPGPGSFTSLDSRLFDLLADSLKVLVQLVSEDGSDRVLQGARSVTDVTV